MRAVRIGIWRNSQGRLTIFVINGIADHKKGKSLIIKQNDPDMLYIFKEIYLDNKNIDIISDDVFDKKRINYNRTKILKLARNVHNIQIKR